MPLDESTTAGQAGHLTDHDTLHAQYNRGGLPLGMRVVGTADAVAATLLDSADATTGWTAVNFNTDKSIDTTVKVQGTGSVLATLWTGTNNDPPTAKLYVDLGSGQAVGSSPFVAFDFRWQNTGPGLGGNAADFYAAKIGSAVALGGTTSQVQLAEVPQDTWVTILIPVGAITSVRSIGLITTSSGSSSTNRVNVWMDNVRLLAATELDTALASTATTSALALANYVPTQTQSRLELASTKSYVDLRPGKEVISRLGGVRNLREWQIPENGSRDVSYDIAFAISQLNAGETLVAPPDAVYQIDSPITIHKNDVTIDFRNARLYGTVHGRITSWFIMKCKGTKLKGGRLFGHRKTTLAAVLWTNVAGTPVTGQTTKELDNQNDEARTPLDVNSEEMYLARNKDGLNVWDLTLKDTAQVANDCEVKVYGVDPKNVVTLRQTTTLTLTATSTVYPITYRPVDLDEKLYVTVKKATATTNNIILDTAAVYGQVLYNGTLEFSAGILLQDAYNCDIEDFSVEGVTGDAIQVSNANVVDIRVRRFSSRGCSRQGMSFNQGRRFLLEDIIIREPHRSGLDVEPFGDTWFVDDITMRRFVIRNCRNHAFALGNWARVTNVVMDDILVTSGRLGLVAGGCRGGSFRNLTYLHTTSGAEYACTFNGQDMTVENVKLPGGFAFDTTTSSFDSVTYTPGGNHARGVTVPKKNYAQVRCTAANSTVSLATSRSENTTWDGTVYTGPFEIPSADFFGLNPGPHRTQFPNTYKGLASSSLWYPSGLTLFDEPARGIRALSGATSRKGNNLRGFDVSVTEAATTKTVAFPTRTIVDFTGRSLTATTGGTLTVSTTYYYRVAARSLYGGPKAAWAEQSVALNASQNAVNIGLSGWKTLGNAVVVGATIWRGTVAGTYTTRYDFVPNESFYSIGETTTTVKDIGTALEVTLLSNKIWGYPTSTSTSTGSLVPADETGYEPDASYAVYLEPSWLTTWIITAKRKDGFDVQFGTAAPAGAIFNWMVVS